MSSGKGGHFVSASMFDNDNDVRTLSTMTQDNWQAIQTYSQ